MADLRGDLAGSILGRVGGTSMVRLSALPPRTSVAIYAKLEGENPSGSVKDRMTLYLLADALESGQLGPDAVLVEASSGNTGISLAMFGARLGLRVLITTPDNVSVERHKLMRTYGAELVLTPGEKGTDGAIERARELGASPGHVWIAQHFNPVNSLAHYETTGREVVEQLGEQGQRRLDAFVATSGTTGTLMGVSARLKEDLPGVEVVAVWPKDKVMGIRRPEGASRPGIYDEKLIDRVVEVTNQEAVDMAGAVARVEGLALGPSGGAAILAALEVAERVERERGGGVVVTLIPDWGERYLSMNYVPRGPPRTAVGTRAGNESGRAAPGVQAR